MFAELNKYAYEILEINGEQTKKTVMNEARKTKRQR